MRIREARLTPDDHPCKHIIFRFTCGGGGLVGACADIIILLCTYAVRAAAAAAKRARTRYLRRGCPRVRSSCGLIAAASTKCKGTTIESVSRTRPVRPSPFENENRGLLCGSRRLKKYNFIPIDLKNTDRTFVIEAIVFLRS